MKKSTIEKLEASRWICDEEGRSTEYMLQFMQDYANVSLNCVIEFLFKKAKEPTK